MKLVDVNILLYAINRGDPRHNSILQWWQAALDDQEPIGIAWLVGLGFLRISANSKALSKSWTFADAMRQLHEWLAYDNVQIVQESERHWTILKGLLERPGMSGKLTMDAHLAAIAIGTGATLVSCDTDFAKFPGLHWQNPLLVSND